MAAKSAAIIFPTNQNPLNHHSHTEKSGRNGGAVVLLNQAAIFSGGYRASPLSPAIFDKLPIKRRPIIKKSSNTKPFSPVMEWHDYKVKIDVDVPVSVAYNCYLDREVTPQWMTIISSVKILEDDPDLSRWSMIFDAFGQDIEMSWLARNMQPIRNQKIHWRSVDGLNNRGAVRFFPKGNSACVVELTVSYEVPQILLPLASALQPFSEGILIQGLQKFAEFVKTYSVESSS